jgi:hypothetical protein
MLIVKLVFTKNFTTKFTLNKLNANNLNSKWLTNVVNRDSLDNNV